MRIADFAVALWLTCLLGGDAVGQTQRPEEIIGNAMELLRSPEKSDHSGGVNLLVNLFAKQGEILGQPLVDATADSLLHIVATEGSSARGLALAALESLRWGAAAQPIVSPNRLFAFMRNATDGVTRAVVTELIGKHPDTASAVPVLGSIAELEPDGVVAVEVLSRMRVPQARATLIRLHEEGRVASPEARVMLERLSRGGFRTDTMSVAGRGWW